MSKVNNSYCVLGKPLIPTNRHGKVRRLLRDKKAKVVKRTPFSIQLLYRTETEEIQNITLGVDAGSKHIGLLATTNNDNFRDFLLSINE